MLEVRQSDAEAEAPPTLRPEPQASALAPPALAEAPPRAEVTPNRAPAPEPIGLAAPILSALMRPDPREPLWKRSLFLALAVVLAYGFFYFITSFLAPAHAGNNQNGYLVGAKNLALSGTTGFEPASPFSFVGWMWVMGDINSTAPGGGIHYPKYPLGLPLLNAGVYRAALWLHGSEALAVQWVYLVNPIAMSLAVLGIFFLARLVAGSFAGVLAMILLGTSPLVLILTNNPNSHATSLCLIVWGVYALLRWWQTGSWWRAIAAGFLLGYAVTVRYTEGLLLLPLAAAGLTMIRYQPLTLGQGWRAAVWMLAGTIALIVNDAADPSAFGWERAISSFFGGELAMWHLGVLLGVPVLVTARWDATHRLFSREALLGGEWLRMIGCLLLVAAAAKAPLPDLAQSTPVLLHILRLTVIVAGLCGAVLLLFIVRWGEPRTWLSPAMLALGWLLPVSALLVYNRLTLGTWTGYDSTNESTGFTWGEFVRKWTFAVSQLYDTGLFFVLPLAVTGLAMAFRWNWRAALVLSLWFWPGTLLYMSYYYGMNMPLIGYLRFFTSMLPPAIVGAVWLIHRASVETRGDTDRSGWWGRGSLAAPIAAGIFVAVASGMNVHGILGPIERDFANAANLAHISDRVREAVPAGSVVFGHSQRLLNHLQFAGSYDLYGSDYFLDGFPVPSIGSRREGAPTPIQPARRAFLRRAYQGLDRPALVQAQNRIVAEAVESQKRVFLVMESREQASFRRTFLPSRQFVCETVQQWVDPVALTPEARRSLAALGTADLGGRGTQQRWYIIEVKPRAPATPPATTQPADAVAAMD